ncbi:MAG: UDP-glucose dehydrogenase family protein [Candidatus Zixiibacteriota bacterium]
MGKTEVEFGGQRAKEIAMSGPGPKSMSGPVKGIPIAVVGGGFVGLVTAAGFAQFGHAVVCIENNEERLKKLQSGHVPFYERDLEKLISENLHNGRLSFTNDLEAAVDGQKAIFIAVGTPSAADGRADLGALGTIAESLASVLTSDQVIVIKSTVPVGTGKSIQAVFSENGHSKNPIAVVNAPEFLREGNAVQDFFHPHRIVLGGTSTEAVELVKHIYRLGMTDPVPIITTNNETAELIKYSSNAFLAMKIGFINELAGLCDSTGIDVLEVARAMGMDGRIGPEFLDPGPGWGGSCFRKDLSELTGLASSLDHTLLIARAVLSANEQHHRYVVEKARKLIGSLDGATIGVLGLAFKANTSDMRDSPAIPIINELLDAGAKVQAYDPQAMEEARSIIPNVSCVDSAIDVAAEADCLLILTEWQEFQMLDLSKMAKMMATPNIVDTRNLLVPEVAKRHGFNYVSMGQA